MYPLLAYQAFTCYVPQLQFSPLGNKLGPYRIPRSVHAATGQPVNGRAAILRFGALVERRAGQE